MEPNYYMMWHDLKEAIQTLVVDGNMIHVEDLERTMDHLYSDHKE